MLNFEPRQHGILLLFGSQHQLDVNLLNVYCFTARSGYALSVMSSYAVIPPLSSEHQKSIQIERGRKRLDYRVNDCRILYTVQFGVMLAAGKLSEN